MALPSNLLALLAGVASHVLYFNRGEHHMYGIFYLNAFLLSLIAGSAAFINLYAYSMSQAFSATLSIATSWLTGVYASLIVYRLFLNPLNKFPGPFMPKLTGFWQAFHYAKLDSYYKLTDLHKKYGDYVRIAPGDLSIIDPAAVDLAFANSTPITKSEWYDGDAPLTSMHTSRDKGLHDKRRRIWSPAFSEKALRDYEPKIDELNLKILERFTEFKGGPINVTKWFNLYSFDAMGRLAFGKDYGMLDSGEKHHALQMLSDGMAPLAFRLPIWFFRVLTRVPGLGAGFQKFVQFCIDELTWRVTNADKAEKSEGADIMSSILKAYKDIAHPEKDTFLQADARLIIVAGSDTTAATFTYLFWHLSQNPDIVRKLRAELDPLTSGDWHDSNIRQAPYLNACITEALRLHPPVPSGVGRKAPAEGVKIGNTYLPPNTVFWLPTYVIHRDERNFADPDSFVPERWTDKPHMVKHQGAWSPFIHGPFSCIGKNLALMELRTLTTRLIQKFDVKLASNEDGNRLLTKTLDHFTVNLGDLELVFKER